MRKWMRIAAVVLTMTTGPTALSGEAPSAKGPLNRISRTPEFVRLVDEASKRGVAWLRRTQAADGSFPEWPGFPGGVTGLVYHTIRVCGVSRDDPAAENAWTALRRTYRKQDLRTYTAATYLMAVTEHGDATIEAGDDRDVTLTKEDGA